MGSKSSENRPSYEVSVLPGRNTTSYPGYPKKDLASADPQFAEFDRAMKDGVTPTNSM